MLFHKVPSKTSGWLRRNVVLRLRTHRFEVAEREKAGPVEMDELNQKQLVTATDVLKKNVFFSPHLQLVIIWKA